MFSRCDIETIGEGTGPNGRNWRSSDEPNCELTVFGGLTA